MASTDPLLISIKDAEETLKANKHVEQFILNENKLSKHIIMVFK